MKGIQKPAGRCLTALVLLFLMTAPLLSQQAILTFGEVWNDRETSASYREALKAYEKSVKEVEAAAWGGDPEMTLQPGYKAQYSESGEPGLTELTLSTGLSVTLARSALQDEKYRAALRAERTEEMYLQESLRDELLSFYTLYSDLWILQQEEPVLTAEKDVAEEKFQQTLELFGNGAALASAAEEAEEDLQQAEDDLNQNRLDQRLAWFSLQQARGRIGTDRTEEIPRLEEFPFPTDMKETPSTLTGKVLAVSPAFAQQTDNITDLNETRDRLDGTDWNMQLKPFLSYGDHDWTLAYNWETRSLDLGYAFPLATYNRTSPSQNNWVTGFNLILSLGTGKEDRLEAAVLEEEILRQKELLKSQEDKLSLELRTLYQKYLLAGESLAQAEKALERQIRFQQAVLTRYDAGQVLRTDVFSAETAVKRSLWKRESTRVELQQLYLSLMTLSGEMSFLVELEQNGRL